MSKQDKSASLWRNGITLMGWFLGWALRMPVIVSGYDDPGYFTRRFREMTRLSPRQWRNRQVCTDAPA